MIDRGRRRNAGMWETAGERAEREQMEQGEWNMGIEKRKAQEQEERLEWLSETLSDALSLAILLENDMETQNFDGIYARILKMMHRSLKGAQKELSAYIRREKA